jgi:hypothetical protein
VDGRRFEMTEEKIQTYTPVQGMIICTSGGDYIKISDYLEEIERLKEALDHAPFQSYGEALREGCDPDEAWECFKEDYRRHVRTVLGEAK